MSQIIIYNSGLAELVTASLKITGLTRAQLGRELAPMFGCEKSTAENYIGQIALGRVLGSSRSLTNLDRCYNRLSLFLDYLGVPAVHPLITKFRDQSSSFNYPPRKCVNVETVASSKSKEHGSFTHRVIDRTIQDILGGT